MSLLTSPAALLAWLAFAAALAALLASSNRQQRRAVTVGGLVLMAVAGVTYIAQGGDLVAKGRPSFSRFTDNVTEPTVINTGVRFSPVPLDTASTTSPPDGMSYSSGTGFFNADVAGKTYTRVRFDALVAVKAANVTFIDCRFAGGAAPTATRNLLSVFHANASNCQVRFCTFRPTNPSEHFTAVGGYEFDVYRCDVSGTVDPVSVTNPNLASGVAGNVNAKVRCSYLHDWYYQSPANSQPSDLQTHNDGFQQANGSNMTFTGNAVWAYCDPTISSPTGPPNVAGKVPNVSGKGNGQNVLACVQITPNGGPVSDVEIAYNWMYGGSVKVQITQKGRGPIARLKIHHNRFADDGTYDNAGRIDVSTLTAPTTEIYDNYWTSGARAGQLIPVNVTGGFESRTDT